MVDERDSRYTKNTSLYLPEFVRFDNVNVLVDCSLCRELSVSGCRMVARYLER